MAIIAFPSAARVASIQWSLDRPAQVNRSQWTGRDQVRSLPWHGRWSASVTLAPIVGEANVLAVRAFLVALKGPVNSFRLPATETQQSPWSPLVAGTHAAGATTLATLGWPASATVIEAGRLFTVNDQLCALTAAATSNGAGVANLVFEPPLRAAAADGTAVTVGRPTALVAMASSVSGWSVDRGQQYGVSFEVEERF